MKIDNYNISNNMKIYNKNKNLTVLRSYGLTVLLSFCLTFISCNKWLELTPFDGVMEDNYWRTKEDVHLFTIGCYSALLHHELIERIILWGEMRADMLTPGPQTNTSHLNVMLGEISPDNSILTWGRFYYVINQCNKLIEKSALTRELDGTFSETLYRQYVAEATAIRSLMYFYLVRSFNDVPLVLRATDNDDQEYFYPPKTPGNDILDTLVLHMKTIIDNNYLPESYSTNSATKGRFTRYGAMALLADIYLWKEDYGGCLAMCNAIIESSRYRMIPVYREEKKVMDISGQELGVVYIPQEVDIENLFERLFVIGNSVESIFEIQFPVNDRELRDPFFDLFGNMRPRLWANTENLDFQIFPSNPLDRAAYDIRSNSFSYRSGTRDIWKWVGMSQSRAVYRSMREFPNWMLYRITDIYMMRAEALNQIGIRNGDQELLERAYNDVKLIRERGNAVDTHETLLASPIDGLALERLILSERAREFAFEGKRWYDVLRNAKRNNYGENDRNRSYLMQMAIFSTTPEKLVSLQNKYRNNDFHYWPIHISDVERNPSLVQNDFYLNFK